MPAKIVLLYKMGQAFLETCMPS